MTHPEIVLGLLPKKRNTHHWKSIAKAAEKLAGERLELFEAEQAALFAMQRIAADEKGMRANANKRARFWSLVSLGLGLAWLLTLAAYAGAVLR